MAEERISELTARLQGWLDHVRGCEAGGQTMAEYARLSAHLQVLREQINVLTAKRFGHSGEKYSLDQLRLLEGYHGYLQVDGYEGYNAIGSQPDIRLVGCMAHARRKFDEALKAQGKAHQRDPTKVGHAHQGLCISRIFIESSGS